MGEMLSKWGGVPGDMPQSPPLEIVEIAPEWSVGEVQWDRGLVVVSLSSQSGPPFDNLFRKALILT